MSDFYQDSAQARMDRLQYQRQLAVTSLQEAKMTDDRHAGGEAAQEIADIDAAAANLVRLHNSYIQAQQPQYVEETAEQKRVKPLKDWRDAAAICGISEEQYVKGYQQMQAAGKLGEFRRSEDKG